MSDDGLVERKVMLNDEEVRQFHEALAQHVYDMDEVQSLVADLSTALNNLAEVWGRLHDTNRIIVNLMSGYGEYGTTPQPAPSVEGR